MIVRTDSKLQISQNSPFARKAQQLHCHFQVSSVAKSFCYCAEFSICEVSYRMEPSKPLAKRTKSYMDTFEKQSEETWICFHIIEVHTNESIHWCRSVIVNRLSGLMKRKQRKQKMAFPKSNVCLRKVVHRIVVNSVWPILAWFVTLPMKTADYQGRSTPQQGREQGRSQVPRRPQICTKPCSILVYFLCHCPGSLQRGEPCDHRSCPTIRAHLENPCSSATGPFLTSVQILHIWKPSSQEHSMMT